MRVAARCEVPVGPCVVKAGGGFNDKLGPSSKQAVLWGSELTVRVEGVLNILSHSRYAGICVSELAGPHIP